MSKLHFALLFIAIDSLLLVSFLKLVEIYFGDMRALSLIVACAYIVGALLSSIKTEVKNGFRQN